jgi:hypothetical protein
MGMSFGYGHRQTRNDRAIHAAVEQGVTFDTAEVMVHSQMKSWSVKRLNRSR